MDMHAVKTISTIYIVIVWVIIAFLLFLLIFRTYHTLIRKAPRLGYRDIKGKYFTKALKVLFGLAMFISIINMPYFAYVGSAFKSLIPAYLNHLLVIVVIWLCIWECYLAFSISERLLQKRWKKVFLSLIIIVILPTSASLFLDILKWFEYPAEEDSYLIELPVRGDWLAIHAGSTETTNYHNAITMQQFAIDMVKVNGSGNFYTGMGKEMQEFPTYGDHVYAPVSGTIVAMTDSLPDKTVTFVPNEKTYPAGNHVLIEFEKSRYLLLAHLKRGSIEVEYGDRINAGDLIGKAGNSGNTSWPHLHIHIQDQPKIIFEGTTGYPFRFKNMNRKRWLSWENVTNGFLIRNDIFSD